jgi:hypothetical protein
MLQAFIGNASADVRNGRCFLAELLRAEKTQMINFQFLLSGQMNSVKSCTTNTCFQLVLSVLLLLLSFICDSRVALEFVQCSWQLHWGAGKCFCKIKHLYSCCVCICAGLYITWAKHDTDSVLRDKDLQMAKKWNISDNLWQN